MSILIYICYHIRYVIYSMRYSYIYCRANKMDHWIKVFLGKNEDQSSNPWGAGGN